MSQTHMYITTIFYIISVTLIILVIYPFLSLKKQTQFVTFNIFTLNNCFFLIDFIQTKLMLIRRSLKVLFLAKFI